MGAQPSEQTIGQIPFDEAFPGRSLGFTHGLHLDDRLTLLMVEEDPAMAEIMNTYLDQLEAGMSAKQGKRARLLKRVAFVFVSSPNSVTPVHFDIEHSLLMQVSGCKTVSVGRFESDAARRHEFNRYWDGSHGRIETLQPEVASYAMTPGQAVYIPP